MGRITLTEEEERELSMYERTNARWLPGAKGPSRTSYHNPRTGQEFRLPIDPYSIAKYSSRGLVLGKAPQWLKEQWEKTPKKIIGGVVEGPRDPDPVGAVEVSSSAPPELAPAVPALQGDVNLAILQALTTLTREVKELRARVDGEELEAAPIVPRQLDLFE